MEERKDLDKIVNYIKMGWTLTEYTCPICNSPILSKKDKFICPICVREVYVAENLEEYKKMEKKLVIDRLEQEILINIKEILETGIGPQNIDIIYKYLQLLRELKYIKKD